MTHKSAYAVQLKASRVRLASQLVSKWTSTPSKAFMGQSKRHQIEFVVHFPLTLQCRLGSLPIRCASIDNN